MLVASRTEGTATAVDDLEFCPKKADEAELLDRGFERLEPMLKAVGLGKVQSTPEKPHYNKRLYIITCNPLIPPRKLFTFPLLFFGKMPTATD